MIDQIAYNFAKIKHNGQFRRDGVTPYFEHCERVASFVDTTEERSIAYCHDLIEDGRATYDEVVVNVDNNTANAVNILSHRKDETYNEYIHRIASCYSIVRKIKIADIVSNLTDKPTPKQILKYNKALQILSGVVQET